ncbi:LPXTG cell wall anchor domain-containing protein [Lacicoccus alkaliphilus]|uniref:LPXTG-motif cell wall anchor domain-containing protein n=1 Tax=Lacicoccus alkaliphilus DSM 16010 TaxID=1123231 RepID=A0A1M7H0U1_9BACL|nr:LPXTG cell wall anchor domain-containing protein [Salinicoccus alkaliphilus]SHM21769.1 LPXTG-motif cell wall anchor domain-containing protein [Salinicoccus alkaliphilus DSM 16010]
MDKKHLKITVISILITSTIFNPASITFADDGEDIDGNVQEHDMEYDADGGPDDDNEVTTGGVGEGESLPAEESGGTDEDVEEQPRETEAVLTPADHVGEAEAETLQEDTTQDESAPDVPASDENSSEETASDEPVNEAPENDGVNEGDSSVNDSDGDVNGREEEAGDASPPVDDDVIQEEEGNETGEGSMPEGEDAYDGGDDAGQAPDNEEGRPSQEADSPLVPVEPETPDAANEDPSVQEEAPGSDQQTEVQPEQPAVEIEPDGNHEVYGGSSEAQSSDDGSRNVQEHAGADVEVEVSEDVRTGVAGKKLHRYNYGDILEGLDLSPGRSDESLALLDKRVNRIMGSKILEEVEMHEEDEVVLEEEIKNETAGITSSDREILPNTGEANNYNFLYSVMLIISGVILFFVTKKPRQQ